MDMAPHQLAPNLHTMRPTLILLHGFPHDSTLWEPNIRALSEVAEVFAPDLLGFGSNRHDNAVMRMDDMAADVHARISIRPTQHIVLCGLSMGGYVAMAFAERWPQLVHGLILCNTRSTADTEEAKVARYATATDALEKGMAVIARAMIPKVLSATTRRERPDLVERMEALMARQDPRGVAAASRGLALRPDRTEVLRHFQRPAMVITGEADELMPLPTSQQMMDVLPHGELVILPKAGHLSNVEAADGFNATVARYLRAL